MQSQGYPQMDKMGDAIPADLQPAYGQNPMMPD